MFLVALINFFFMLTVPSVFLSGSISSTHLQVRPCDYRWSVNVAIFFLLIYYSLLHRELGQTDRKKILSGDEGSIRSDNGDGPQYLRFQKTSATLQSCLLLDSIQKSMLVCAWCHTMIYHLTWIGKGSLNSWSYFLIHLVDSIKNDFPASEN